MKKKILTKRLPVLTLAVGLATTAACAAPVPEPEDGVVLSRSILLMKSGELDTLAVQTFVAEEAAQGVTWSCDDPAVATVADGIVTAVADGTATITVVSADGSYRASCTVIVSPLGAEVRNSMPGGMPPGGDQGGKGDRKGKRDRNRGDNNGERPEGMPEGMPQGMPPGGGRPPQGMRPDGQRPDGNRPQGNRPDGMRPGGMGPGGGAGADNSDAVDPKGYVQTEGEVVIENASYSSSTVDANAVKVSGGTLTLTDCTLMKDGGDASNSDGSSFYGTNAAILAQKGGEITVNGGSIMTDAIGANGIVAYGGKVVVRDMAINCAARLSRGIHATGGGTIEAYDLNIMTQDANSSVIALDRGGGTVKVVGGTYDAAGADCAVLYSTGDLTVNNIIGSSLQGEMGVIEGNNYIAINNSELTSHAGPMSRGLMILQSGSGDAGEGLNGIITVAGGSLTMTDSGTPLIEIVTNVTGKVTLDGVQLTIPSGILMKVDFNQRWQTNGATGVLVLQGGEGTVYEGNIVADEYSSAQVTVNAGTAWRGAYDADNTAKATSLTLNGGSWTLTADSFVDSITLKNGGTIDRNGFNLTCDSINEE